MVIGNRCPFCGVRNEVEVKAEDFLKWNEGALIQDAFPYLSADDREILNTGICSKCWDDMFLEE